MGNNTLKNENKDLEPLKTIEDVKDFIKNTGVNNYASHVILKNAKEELNKTISHNKDLLDMPSDSNVIKAFSLFEFDNNILGTLSVYEEYRTFFVDFANNLQKEYQCHAPSEKSLCQLAALSYARILESQRIITRILSSSELDDRESRIIAVMGKEVDRATRQYLTALQTLQAMKQPALNVNIRTQTAVVGQNQIVQSNNK